MNRYVVRGKDGVDVWWQSLPDSDWDTTTLRSKATSLSLAAALRAAEEMRAVASHVCVLAVAEDGTETPLPTYEEALAEVERLRGALRDVEWSGDKAVSGEPCCVLCGADAKAREHAEGCAMPSLLAGTP